MSITDYHAKYIANDLTRRQGAGGAERLAGAVASAQVDRFVVTSLPRKWDARALYEKLYCARGEAEKRIGEPFELFADRASSTSMNANQLRLLFSATAYVLIEALRRTALKHTQFADASVVTIRLKRRKPDAQVRITRSIHFAIASACPN